MLLILKFQDELPVMGCVEKFGTSGTSVWLSQFVEQLLIVNLRPFIFLINYLKIIIILLNLALIGCCCDFPNEVF